MVLHLKGALSGIMMVLLLGMSTTENSEVLLNPVKLYLDPFRKSENAYLVLCETYQVNGLPHDTNSRYKARVIFDI